MKKLFFGPTFWSLYTFGLSVAFPTYLYYGNSGYGTPPLNSATEAFGYLGLGIAIWSIVLIAYTRFYLRAAFSKSVTLLHSVLLLFLLLGAFVYPVFSYGLESKGSGWSFLKIYHPWISVPLTNLGVAFVAWLVIKMIRGVAGGNLQAQQHGRDKESYGP